MDLSTLANMDTTNLQRTSPSPRSAQRPIERQQSNTDDMEVYNGPMGNDMAFELNAPLVVPGPVNPNVPPQMQALLDIGIAQFTNGLVCSTRLNMLKEIADIDILKRKKQMDRDDAEFQMSMLERQARLQQLQQTPPPVYQPMPLAQPLPMQQYQAMSPFLNFDDFPPMSPNTLAQIHEHNNQQQ